MKYVASCSGGKDSVATVILAHENNEPLDDVIFAEVMFSRNISGELPEHIDFIKNVAFPKFEEWGYKTHILRSDITFVDNFFYQLGERSKYAGKLRGFPLQNRCHIQRDCKLRAVEGYWKNVTEDYTEYVGIAIDEPKRLERVHNNGKKISLLEKYGYTEDMARQKCKEYGLLSPSYEFTLRGGCWFCPNMKDTELKHLREYHNDLWNLLVALESLPTNIFADSGNVWAGLSGVSIREKEKEFEFEENQMRFDI